MSRPSNSPIELELDQIHIWSAVSVHNNDRIKRMLELLSEDEVLRAGKYRFNRDRCLFVTARFLLRSLLGRYLKLDPREIIFDYSEFGKPSYQKNNGIDFNVSHSGNRIIIGVAKNLEIGVDIEKIKQDFDPLDLAKNFFSEDEVGALTKVAEDQKYRAFYRCWTRKESFIKAVGQGLSYPLDSFAVSLNDDCQAKFLKIDNLAERENNWKLHSFTQGEDYIAALSVNGNPDAVQFFDWEFNDM